MANLLDPSVLFFVVGLGAGLVRSTLMIPEPVSRFLSLYLLMALGLKGGFAINATGLGGAVISGLAVAVVMAVAVPLVAYRLLNRVVGPFEAVGIAAVYGSVSAVTFTAATQYLDQVGLPYGGHMAAAMALMESPAIVIGLLLADRVRRARGGASTNGALAGVRLREGFQHALTDGSQIVLIGAMVVGIVSGPAGQKVMAPFSSDIFKGMLAFFLLDMGTVAAGNLRTAASQPRWAVAYAVVAPWAHAFTAAALSWSVGLGVGDTTLAMVLAASASYIAVPAALRHAVPEATPGVYIGLSLGVTFPMNLVIGIPVYATIARAITL
jgi:hypothetical protein